MSCTSTTTAQARPEQQSCEMGSAVIEVDEEKTLGRWQLSAIAWRLSHQQAFFHTARLCGRTDWLQSGQAALVRSHSSTQA